MKNTQQQSNKLLNNKFFIIGLAAVLIVGIVGASVFINVSASGGDKPTTGIWVKQDLNTYTGKVVADDTDTIIERWKYTIRDDDTCEPSIFENGGQDAGNSIDVVYGSNSYTPADKNVIDQYDGQYICFAGVDVDGSWHHAGRQLNWIYQVHSDDPVAPTPQDLCPGDLIPTPEGDCVAPVEEGEPCDLGGIGNSEGLCVPSPSTECLDGLIPTPEGDCVAPVEEGEPCDLGGIGNSEGLCVPCPTGEGYVIVNNSCVPEAGSGPSTTHSDLATNRFDDISATDSYATAVGFLLEQEVTTGCDEDSFCPGRQLTRREFVTFLYRLLDQPKHPSTGSELFDDVVAGSYADEAIGWAHHAGVTTGCDEDLFCPSRTVTKAHVATFLHRLVGEPPFSYEPHITITPVDFDSDAYYAEAAGWAVRHGIVLDCGGAGGQDEQGQISAIYSFCPGNPVTRSDAATIIYTFAITPESWGSADLPI